MERKEEKKVEVAKSLVSSSGGLFGEDDGLSDGVFGSGRAPPKKTDNPQPKGDSLYTVFPVSLSHN